MKRLNEILSEAETEEELKNFFAKFCHIKLSTKNFIDLYTPQILFEFKLDAPLQNINIRAKVIAQTLYYVRRLKFGRDYREVSQNICAVTKNSAVFFPTESFAAFYDDATAYDWDLAPSSPCKKLVAALTESEIIRAARVYDFSKIDNDIAFATLINNTRKRQERSAAKKQITEINFYQIFEYWQSIFGADVVNGKKASEYFVTDIEQGKSSLVDNNSVIFRMSSGEIREKFIDHDKYRDFWSRYEKIYTAREIIAIRQKMDRMTEINLRRFTGEFFTPVAFAEKAADYLVRTVGEWWRDDNFRLWDMAAGTGNLEFALPEDAIKHCYISTLLQDDADYCKKIFPAATVFQYDYLNDDENKLPENLRADLNNPNIKWIIFINPPYATASNKDLTTKNYKPNVSMTLVRKLMNADGLGEVSRELFSQFIYRISRDFADRQAWLGMFSTPKYINSNNDQKMRDKFFKYKFERGFVFSSKVFNGCNGNFSVGFLVWDMGNVFPLDAQEISLDVFNNDVEKIAEKIFRTVNKNETLNKWINRPSCTKKFPPMSGALNVASKNKDRRDRIAENFLASLIVKGNEFSNQTYVSILSAPYVSAGGMSITPENFEQAMIVHMVRRLPKATWLNDRDQFMQPTKNLSREFISDSVIWSLFAPSNQTVSLRDVAYEGEVYRIKNNFFPFLLAELQNWRCTSSEIRWQIAMAHEDRFAALWLKNRELSVEASAVLTAGRELYKRFYAELDTLDVRRWKIADWDAGWYQVRMALGATVDLSALSAKLLPQIYELGFLRDEVKYF